MDIIQRNFLRLLRLGAFDEREPAEPMTEWKWDRLYQLSRIHGITPWIADGLRKSEDDFFIQLPPTLRQRFYDDNTPRTEPREPQELTNPLLNNKLQKLAEEAGTEDPTFNLLTDIIAIARNILTQGISLRQLVGLATCLRTTGDNVMYDVLTAWTAQLHLEQMAQLEGALLMELFHFRADQIPFTHAAITDKTKRVVTDIFSMTEKNAADWYFTQGESIFVRSSDSNAMMWHVKHSARYMRYYPTEAVTNFLSNFAHSMSHIEE